MLKTKDGSKPYRGYRPQHMKLFLSLVVLVLANVLSTIYSPSTSSFLGVSLTIIKLLSFLLFAHYYIRHSIWLEMSELVSDKLNDDPDTGIIVEKQSSMVAVKLSIEPVMDEDIEEQINKK